MKYVDLSQHISNGMPVYPGDMNVSLVHIRHMDKDTYNAYSFSTGLHAGTHIDCPMHLLESTKTIAEYPIESFIGNGVLIDARGEEKISLKQDYYGIIKSDDVVLIYTDMDEKYGSKDYYLTHPVITRELAEFFMTREIKMIGIDMPSPDFPPFPIHKLLLNNNIFIVENVTNLKQLVGIESFEVFAEPLKIHAEASLVRAFARIY